MFLQNYYIAIDPKYLRETLCLAQAAIHHHPQIGENSKKLHVATLQRMIDECDRKRPLGVDGTHGKGELCTPECGCESYKPIIRSSRYTPVPVYCPEDDLTFRSVRECAQHYNTTSSTISKIISGRGKTHKGKSFTRAIPKSS